MLSAVISSCFYPALQLALQPVHQWYVHPGPLVLGTTPLNSSTPMADRDKTVHDVLNPATYHFNWRTAKPLGLPWPGCDEPTSRCQTPWSIWTLGGVSLYPRRTFYPLSDGLPLEPPDHYDRLSTLLDLSVSQSGRLMPLHSTNDFTTVLSLLTPPLLLGGDNLIKLPTIQCLAAGLRHAVNIKNNKRGISLVTRLADFLGIKVSLLC